jgi:hypothetical protein
MRRQALTLIGESIGLSILVLFLFAPPMAAQNVTPRSPETHQFASPMVLDYALDDVFKNSPKGVQTEEMRYFECRGVSIQRFVFSIERGEQSKKASAGGLVFLNNNSGKDKKVSITFDVRTEASSFGSGRFQRLNVEQGDMSGKVLLFPITLPAKVAEPYPFLRITLELFDY